MAAAFLASNLVLCRFTVDFWEASIVEGCLALDSGFTQSGQHEHGVL